MKDQPFQFEVENLIAQFIAAMDDIIINRYNNNREVQDKLLVRMLYSPKERVLMDLLDKAQNIQLPVISISIASIARDPSRVFNKIAGSNYATPNNPRTLGKLLQPVPINITLNFSILARYQKDIDQILTNFIPYFDPYITLSWRIPDMQDQEIRSTVEWSGNAVNSFPLSQNVPANQIARNQIDTTFTIKGWLFKQIPVNGGDPLIFNITTNFYALCSINGFSQNIPQDSIYWDQTTLSGASAGIIIPIPRVFDMVIGNGISVNYTIPHNLGTFNTLVQVYDTITKNIVYPSIQNIDVNNSFIHFSNAPSISAYKVVIIA